VGPAFTSPPFYVIVVAALAAVLIGEERSHQMWKTVLVAQPSRVAVLAGKLVVAMLAVGVLMGGALVAGVAVRRGRHAVPADHLRRRLGRPAAHLPAAVGVHRPRWSPSRS
jgi:hypothetical protein